MTSHTGPLYIHGLQSSIGHQGNARNMVTSLINFNRGCCQSNIGSNSPRCIGLPPRTWWGVRRSRCNRTDSKRTFARIVKARNTTLTQDLRNLNDRMPVFLLFSEPGIVSSSQRSQRNSRSCEADSHRQCRCRTSKLSNVSRV